MVTSFEHNLKWTVRGTFSIAFQEFQEAHCITVVSLHYKVLSRCTLPVATVRLLPQTHFVDENAENVYMEVA
jgi:hypothetical protein